VVRLPMTSKGMIDVEDVAALVDERTVAICASAVASSSGLRQPVEALGSIPRPDSCLYFVDAAQAIGQFDLTLPGTSADVMVAPGRKWLRAGRGQAMMALSDRALRLLGPPVIIDQGAGTWCPDDSFHLWEDARRFEAWEFSAAGRLGLRASLQELNRIGVANVRAHNVEKLRRLAANLRDVDGLTIFEEEASDPAFLTFRHAVLSVDRARGPVRGHHRGRTGVARHRDRVCWPQLCPMGTRSPRPRQDRARGASYLFDRR
jgi:cysteine desulfurase / selenocysteine lyase